ncbi:GNAT family N-acetyltransferase [Chryseobacterium taklimakanense]|uniref:N-acetyltransferase n=1 Tax=Chryseobacterium taklimakanense TaxID=536441 RepID=A0A3G8WFJ2_9FLAO|nr:GNAT family N-acetyltransferase [Chryseobacterium taklimakanense]AZI19329.1 N-acetyltransferase [Chryseobacterium taklimakanense]
MKTNFEKERLYLRPTSLDDADINLKLLNTEEFKKYVGDRNVNTLDESREYLKNRSLPQIEKLGYGNFTLIKRDTGEKIGSCGLFHREGLDVVDIGFAFLPEYFGKGYGYEAASRILRAGFEEYGLQKISAITVKENVASQKLIEKLGLKFQKIVQIPNDPEDLLYYEVSKQEWQKNN